MREDSGTVSGEAWQVPKEQAMLPHIKSWRPSTMKTGLRNRLIGKKILFDKSPPDPRGSR
jgi:hypothetical protein